MGEKQESRLSREMGVGWRTTLRKLEGKARAAAQLKGFGKVVSLSEMSGMWVRVSATVPAGEKMYGTCR